MSMVIRKASPLDKVNWWFWTLMSCGLYALVVGYPQ